MDTDTIAAIATPLGEGALAVIRISGLGALGVADRMFQPSAKPRVLPSAAATHTVHYGHVVRGGMRLDEVLLTVLRAPRTFTREDVVEISCHGGVLAARLVFEAVLAAGARAALPGEFTKRAFLNGRLDLTQAEAVADIIHARTDLALSAAQEQLEGKLARRIDRLREDLMLALAHVEAHIDFPDEDIAPDTHLALLKRFADATGLVDELLKTGREGQILRRGIRAAIVGRPNAGKSSLLNLLLGRDRAIVSPVAGTTRDTIEETASIRGLPVVFIDTAGLRDSGDAIEQEGVRRSRESLARADLVLHILDASEALDPVDAAELALLRDRARVVVRNKCDLPPRLALSSEVETVSVSCATGEGLERLKEAICLRVWGGEIRAEMLEATINARHQDALQRARTSLEQTRQAMAAGRPLELVALDLRMAVNAVGEIVGKTTTEDLLDSIFSTFCIGK
jgi:tRNA modification GTPase